MTTLLLSSLALGCSIINLRNAGTATDVLRQIPATRGAAVDAKNYLTIANKLKKFHDGGSLNESDVLDILKRGGVIKGSPSLPSPTGRRSAPKVSQVPPPTETYHGAYRWPVDSGVVSSEFGPRWGKNHAGIDIAAEMGIPVKASAAGVVLYAGSTMRGYGNAIILRHDNTVTTLYSHNKALLVKNGETVAQGQTIALLGSTGKSTGPHVHFEIREGDVAVNPRKKLPRMLAEHSVL